MDMRCKICDGLLFKYIGKPRTNPVFPRILKNDYRIFQCQRCDYYFIFPEIDLSQEEWKKFYETDYFQVAKQTQWHKRIRQKERIERLELLENSLKIAKGKFLDMGCGEGLVLKNAELLGFEPYGLDIARNLENTDSDRYHFFLGNVFEANYPDEYFSAIYMDSVLEHLSNPMETLKELKRILKPGGALLIVVPNEDSMENSFKKLCYRLIFQAGKYGKIKPFIAPYHIQGFNKKSLSHALKSIGLNLLVLQDFGGNYPFWKNDRIGSKPFFADIFLYGIGLLSIVWKNQIQILAIAKK